MSGQQCYALGAALTDYTGVRGEEPRMPLDVDLVIQLQHAFIPSHPPVLSLSRLVCLGDRVSKVLVARRRRRPPPRHCPLYRHHVA